MAIATAAGLAATGIACLAESLLSQPQVQKGLSQAANALTSGISSALDSVSTGLHDFFVSSGSSHGLMDTFSSTVNDPYLDPWIDDSLTIEQNWAKNWSGKGAIAKDDADTIAKSIDIPYLPMKKPAYFPEDPNDFQPLGLTPVYRKGTKNGPIIQWENPITNDIIFQWDANTNKSDGPHYHIKALDEGLPNEEHTHFYPGSLVPEPWASVYF